jgi:hypothetical protein
MPIVRTLGLRSRGRGGLNRSAILPLLLCMACEPDSQAMTQDSSPPTPPPATVAAAPERRPSLEGLIDVSGDDCTVSSFVYDAPPGAELASATAFINDGCFGDRIFLGINGERRELRRAENTPLGTGGEYSDSIYRVAVKRGRLISRTVDYEYPDAQCQDSTHKELTLLHEAEVVIAASGVGERTIQGTLWEPSCGP